MIHIMQIVKNNQIYFGYFYPLPGESSPNSLRAVRRAERGASPRGSNEQSEAAQ